MSGQLGPEMDNGVHVTKLVKPLEQEVATIAVSY
jgi:hypothetical protein